MTIPNLSSMGVAIEAAPQLAELKKASEQFESMFIKDMLKTMRKSFKETHIGEVPGREMFRDMLDDTMATKASESGGVGIAQYLYDSTKNQVLRQVSANQALTARAVSAQASTTKISEPDRENR